MKCTSIAGRNKFDKFDFYQTPSWAIKELLKKEKIQGTILEPCSGNGAISKVLEQNGLSVFSSDIRDDVNVYGEKGVDIFNIEKMYDNIITNPPYTIAMEVIKKSLEITNNKVATLLKLSFLEGKKRYIFFKTTPLKTVYVFSKRVQMYPYGFENIKKNGPIAFAWFVWEHGYKDKPYIDWINP